MPAFSKAVLSFLVHAYCFFVNGDICLHTLSIAVHSRCHIPHAQQEWPSCTLISPGHVKFHCSKDRRIKGAVTESFAHTGSNGGSGP